MLIYLLCRFDISTRTQLGILSKRSTRFHWLRRFHLNLGSRLDGPDDITELAIVGH
jgi:hypothetical protein